MFFAPSLYYLIFIPRAAKGWFQQCGEDIEAVKVQETGSRIAVTRQRKVALFGAAALFIAAVTLLFSKADPHPVLRTALTLAALALACVVPYSYSIVVDLRQGKLVASRKALLRRRRQEMEAAGLRWLRTDDSSELSSVIAETDHGAVKLLMLPEEEADAVVGHVNKFLKKAMGRPRQDDIGQPETAGPGFTVLRYAPYAAFFVFSSIAIFLSFFEETLKGIEGRSALAGLGAGIFLGGGLYLFFSLAWHFNSGTSNRIQFRMSDSATNVALSVLVVMFSLVLFAAALF